MLREKNVNTMFGTVVGVKRQELDDIISTYLNENNDIDEALEAFRIVLCDLARTRGDISHQK